MSNALNQLKNVPVDSVSEVPGFNTRIMSDNVEDDPELIGLAEDIAQNGLANPIRVTPGEDNKFLLVAGHRRLMAIKYANEKLGAGIRSIMAVVTRELTDEQKDSILLADTHSAKLKPLEAAKALQRFIDRGMSQSDVAKRFKMTVAYAGDLKLLASAPEAVKVAVEDGSMAATEAVRAIKEYGPENAETIVKEALEESQATTLAEPSVEASGDGSEATTNESSGSLAIHNKGKRQKITKAVTERVAKAKNIPPKRVKVERTVTVPEPGERDPEALLHRVAAHIDTMIGHIKVGNDAAARAKVSDMAYWLRTYLMEGYTVDVARSGITASTPDEDLEFAAEEDTGNEHDKAA